MTTEFPDFLQVLGVNASGDTVVKGKVSGLTYVLTYCCREVVLRNACGNCRRPATEDRVVTGPLA